MSALIYRRVFSDFAALRLIRGGKMPIIDDLKRRVFVAERRSDFRRPDHFYKGYLEDRIGEAASIADLVRNVLNRVGEDHLEWSRTRITIRSDQFEHWQHGLPFFSP